eukprot:scaffold875_cov185-Amphora_coffeaeformis.AAC.2
MPRVSFIVAYHPRAFRLRTIIWPPRRVRRLGRSRPTTIARCPVPRWDSVVSWQSRPWYDPVADRRGTDTASVCPDNGAPPGVYCPWCTYTWRSAWDIGGVARDPDGAIGGARPVLARGPG